MMSGETSGKHGRWWAGTVFGVVAGVVVIVGVANACTMWMGKMDVKGNGTGSGTVTATGGRNAGMTYCSNPSGTAKVPTSSATVNVTLAAGTCNTNPPDNPNQLPASTYDLRWVAGTFDPNAFPVGADCMSDSDPDIGDIVVDSSGAGTAASISFNPGSPTSGIIQICVTDRTAGDSDKGMQVPVSVL